MAKEETDNGDGGSPESSCLVTLERLKQASAKTGGARLNKQLLKREGPDESFQDPSASSWCAKSARDRRDQETAGDHQRLILVDRHTNRSS